MVEGLLVEAVIVGNAADHPPYMDEIGFQISIGPVQLHVIYDKVAVRGCPGNLSSVSNEPDQPEVQGFLTLTVGSD